MSIVMHSFLGRTVTKSATALASLSIVFLLISSPAWAVTKTRVKGTGAAAGVITNPGRSWMEGEVLHIRGQVEEQILVSGDLVGTQRLVLNLDLNMKNGVGNAHNIVTLDVTWVKRGITGRFHGHVAGHVRNGAFYGKVAYEGSGGFSGMKFFAIATGQPGEDFFRWRGVILEP